MGLNLNDIGIIGWWTQEAMEPDISTFGIHKAILKISKPIFIVNVEDTMGAATYGTITIGKEIPDAGEGYPLCAYAPPLLPEDLGNPQFRKEHKLRYAYIIGDMANGISSCDMVEFAGQSGMLGFFGSGGLSLDEIESATCRLKSNLQDIPFGMNLIHTPGDLEYELAVVNLYIKHGIKLISAAAYMRLTFPLVYYRVHGIYKDSCGNIITPNKIIAKISRVEVAEQFLSPPPKKILEQLVSKNLITQEQASIAEYIPMAEDITAEADSGGHTDNRPAIALLPTIIALRDQMQDQYNYKNIVRIGLAGGIATPVSTAAAFAMGADYVLTGSINQSCIEADTSEVVKEMLAKAGQADVTMAPAADMFEMGVKVQVLKKGTMFAQRSTKLYELYSKYNDYYDIPEKERETIEKKFLQKSFDNSWIDTKEFFTKRDPSQVERAESNSKHKMALVFRSYLGRSSKWAMTGEPSRKMDYQIWCGPAIGAFNEWVKGSFLEEYKNRDIVTIGMNLLFGACVAFRINWLKSQKILLPQNCGRFKPLSLSEINSILSD
ncbi:MAG: PfaD family polyunsaturated fatty acid/polyketide biosynthesis protein [Desulfobacterales bacterium]|nr:PfaD family polyunsaturated fatty acid/polyketide biosynthesis protein [Desulfobacterales bacterium]